MYSFSLNLGRRGSTPYSWKEKLTTGTVALAVEGGLHNNAVQEVRPSGYNGAYRLPRLIHIALVNKA